MRQWPDDRIAFGGDYNPEQWPRAVWDDDMRLMRAAGVSFVTLGVFSWSWLEPSKGEYSFEWLDEVMDLLHANGIAVDLATATATPPPWLTSAYPEILPVDHDGHTLWPGSRQSWCPSSPLYRDFALALTERLATRYADHPALAMWHVSNEYACHNLPCYCDTCAAAFRRWLEQRYATLDELNDAWGTAFWSQRYTAWDDILPPRRTTTFSNPTHVLDYSRFGSDTLLDFYRAEHEVDPAPLPRRADHDELHDPRPLPAARLPRLGPVPGRRQHRPLRRRRPAAPPRRAVLRRRPHPWAGRRPAVDAHGALDERGQLAAGQPGEGARRHHPRLADARRARRRRPRLLPVAPVAVGLGEVPLGARAARGRGQRPVPRGLRAGRHRRAAR